MCLMENFQVTRHKYSDRNYTLAVAHVDVFSELNAAHTSTRPNYDSPLKHTLVTTIIIIIFACGMELADGKTHMEVT